MKTEVLERFIEKMSWIRKSSKSLAMTFNVLVKEKDNTFVAHCLELDIVATADTVNQVKNDIISLIIAQIDYAFSNDNLENLFHSAPSEVWSEFFSCKEKIEERHKLKSFYKKDTTAKGIVPPPWIITNTCEAANLYYA